MRRATRQVIRSDTDESEGAHETDLGIDLSRRSKINQPSPLTNANHGPRKSTGTLTSHQERQSRLGEACLSMKLGATNLGTIVKFIQETKIHFDELKGNKHFQTLLSMCRSVLDLVPDENIIQKGAEIMFVKQSRRTVLLVQQIESIVAHGQTSIKSKVYAYIKPKDASQPLMGAISGWSSVAQHDLKLLNNKEWTQNVLDFCRIYGLHLNRSGSDFSHPDKIPGVYQACHVEKKLILYYACEKVKELFGINHSRLLYTLESLRSADYLPEVEILISVAPCRDCLKFKAEVEQITGLKFTITPCRNLTEIQPTGGNKSRTQEGIVGPLETRTSRIEVVIHAKSSTELRKGLLTSRKESVREQRWSEVITKERFKHRFPDDGGDEDAGYADDEYLPPSKRSKKDRRRFRRGMFTPCFTSRKSTSFRRFPESPNVGAASRKHIRFTD